MKTDYLPSTAEQDHSEITLVVIKARSSVLRDPNLTFGARVLFVYLLDLAMNPYANIVRGVVTISATRISEFLHCYEKSIFPWIESLERGGHLWKDKQFMPNFWAMNRYHITALDPMNEPAQLPTRDGLWGNGVRRPASPTAGGTVGKTTAQTRFENLQLTQNQPEAGGNFTPQASEKPPLTAVENPPPRAVEKPPLTAVEKPPLGVVEKPPAGRVQKQTRPVVETTHIRESQLQSERNFLSSKISSKGLKPALKSETDFVERLTRLEMKFSGEEIGAKIAKNFGPQWRMSYREDPDRAERALNDVRAAYKENRILKSIGATWRVRWNEFHSRKVAK